MLSAVKKVLVLDAQIERRQTLKALLESVGAIVVARATCTSEVMEPCCAIVLTALAYEEVQVVMQKYPGVPILLHADSAIDVQVLKTHTAGLVRVFPADSDRNTIMQVLSECRHWSTEQEAQSRIATIDKLLVGESTAIKKIREIIFKLAQSDINVLIRGESGTGKEIVARSIHLLSPRHGDAFLPVNCGAIPGELLESELFGHERGAFTGAVTRRVGRFEMAKKGTLFLDEIGDMPCAMQVKLLRVLQEKVFERVGGGASIGLEARMIAATHCDLEKYVQDGRFREDLYYRINVYPVYIPPLRDRLEDIPLLIEDITRKLNISGKLEFSHRALQALMSYAWPGNVRELSNLLERLMVQCPNQIIDLSELPERYQQGGCPVSALHIPPPMPRGDFDLKEFLSEVESTYIRKALDESQGVVAQAAQRLGVGRTTLVEKMRKYKIYRADIHDMS